MKRNVGKIDRIIRIIAGLAIIAVGLYYQSWWGAIGLLPLGTALNNWCPPYAILGINTCSIEKK